MEVNQAFARLATLHVERGKGGIIYTVENEEQEKEKEEMGGFHCVSVSKSSFL